MKLEYTKTDLDNYVYLKQILKEQFYLSSRLILKLKQNKKIFVNGSFTYLDKVLNVNDKISVIIDFEEDNSNIIPTEMDLDILYEDEGILVVNKPAGVPVHPSMLHYCDSLSNGVKFYFDKIRLNRKIRPVNRLDRNTSGIVIFAKDEYIHDVLSKQMQNKVFKKKYIAFCEGIFEKKHGTINAPVARKDGSIIERCVSSLGKTAITHYKVIKQLHCYDIDFSILSIELETGRTHQIRVHTAYIGHPIIGDSLYGNESSLINRQALHACEVDFINPITHKKMAIKSKLPDDMKKLASL